ncbi:NAD-dependent deacetylase [Natrialbaceae archaeon GCM10025810]|uniref:SIR2 family NAD-dependent protein deacylase n=1 Tax=Halovalidus salilacus TaxID=3075124 RepID=UPI00360823FD
MDEQDLEALADEIRRADATVAFTGAGISAPSGIPTFRDDGGVWERFEEGQFTYGRFRSDPVGFWRDRLELQRELFGGEYEPNAAHEALADLGRSGHLAAVITQNTDGLHEEAHEEVRAPADGETAILELHGNSQRAACDDCGFRIDGDEAFERAETGELPPTCDCGGVFKPDVVLFGERLPPAVLQRSRRLARESDVFLAIGSSLAVEPAASLPRNAAARGATLAVINLEPTPRDDDAEYVFREDVTDVLPALRSAVESA